MNELYWQPGGNPDIKAENSWNAEYSLISRLFQKNENVALSLSATAFSSLVDDWILWLPQNNLWYADNISRVWARGVELGTGFTLGDLKKSADLQLSYTYSRSTNESSAAEAGVQGKQLIYTPLHNAAGKLSLVWSSWKLILYGNYTGSTYLSPDNTSSLPGFFLSDISLRKDFNIKGLLLGLYARSNNIFNTEYQAVAYRPMPGRNFQLSLSLTFKN
jgi:iron complex outermembrane receptor protein